MKKNALGTYTNSRRGGYVLLTVIVFFMVISLSIVLGVASPVVRQIRIARNFLQSRQSYFAAEAVSEDLFYKTKNTSSPPMTELLPIDGVTATATTTVTGSNAETIVAQGNKNNVIRNVSKDLAVTNGFSFIYGVQAGIGGVSMQNGSIINGNVYASGAVASNNTTANKYNYINGTVVSAGPTGSINQIHSTSTAYAHNITNSTIDSDAYYSSIITNTAAGGANCPNSHCHSGSVDLATTSMPVSDALITQWESDATAGGVISGNSSCPSGTYTISSSMMLGPKEIDCDVNIAGTGNPNTTVTLTGSVWVKGNITIQGNSIIQIQSSIGDKSVAMIADNSGSPLTGGTILIQNSTSYLGATQTNGTVYPDSYVMLISQNRCAEQANPATCSNALAIDVKNGATGNLLVYAPHGQIKLENNVNLREVTGYLLTLIGNSIVNYQVGLAQALFVAGPSGSWKIKKWREVQ